MKPLSKGKARSELAANIKGLVEREFDSSFPSDETISRTAAVLGGAIDSALDEMGFKSKEDRAFFWKVANHNCWMMTRSLKASGQLDKIK